MRFMPNHPPTTGCQTVHSICTFAVRDYLMGNKPSVTMRLTESDLRFIVETVADQRPDHDHIIELVRDKDDLIEPMLDDPRLLDRLYNDPKACLRVSPYLMFSLLVRRLRKDLEKEPFLFQRDAGGKRIPIFEVPQAIELLGKAAIRDYLTEMLCSFVRAGSGVLYRNEQGMLQERKFSDLDMDDMIALCRWVEPHIKPRLYKRIADIALFVAGVYPDHTSHFVRRRRSQQWRIVHDYEREGRHFYTLVARSAHPPWPAPVFERLAEQFLLVCAVLSALSERYLKPLRARYLLGPGTA